MCHRLARSDDRIRILESANSDDPHEVNLAPRTWNVPEHRILIFDDTGRL